MPRPVIFNIISALTMSELLILDKYGIAFLKIYLQLDMDHVCGLCTKRKRKSED